MEWLGSGESAGRVCWRLNKINQAASFTLSRNVLGFGPLFLGP